MLKGGNNTKYELCNLNRWNFKIFYYLLKQLPNSLPPRQSKISTNWLFFILPNAAKLRTTVLEVLQADGSLLYSTLCFVHQSKGNRQLLIWTQLGKMPATMHVCPNYRHGPNRHIVWQAKANWIGTRCCVVGLGPSHLLPSLGWRVVWVFSERKFLNQTYRNKLSFEDFLSK